jgi:hypothetical protein
MRVERGDLSVLWMTLGGIIVAASICAGIPLGLAVDSKSSILLVVLIFFVVFIIGSYMCLASFGTLPLPELGKRRRIRAEREAEKERQAQLLEAENEKQRELRAAEVEEAKDKERREAAMKSIRNEVKQAENKPKNEGAEND